MRINLTAEQKAEIRRRAARGESQAAIARRIGCSQASVSRVIHAEETPASMTGPLATAVDEYLSAIELADEQRLGAATLRLLAAKIDWCAASPAVGAAASLPALVREFTALLGELAPAREDVAGAVARLLRPLSASA